MLQRLARACVRHRWIVIGSWVAILVVLNGIAGSVGPDWRTEFVLPSGEARDVQDLLTVDHGADVRSPQAPAVRAARNADGRPWGRPSRSPLLPSRDPGS